MKPKIAVRIKKVDGWKGEAYWYKVKPPLDGHEDVIVSSVIVPYTGPETYIFGADENGKVKSMSELSGSYRGGLNHRKALEGAGYTVVVG